MLRWAYWITQIYIQHILHDCITIIHGIWSSLLLLLLNPHILIIYNWILLLGIGHSSRLARLVWIIDGWQYIIIITILSLYFKAMHSHDISDWDVLRWWWSRARRTNYWGWWWGYWLWSWGLRGSCCWLDASEEHWIFKGFLLWEANIVLNHITIALLKYIWSVRRKLQTIYKHNSAKHL